MIGFNVKVESNAVNAAKREGVQIKLYSIIYELIDQMKEAMAGLLDPEHRETVIGHAEVKQVFELTKGIVAGCLVTDGRIARTARARVLRGRQPIYDGGLSTLRRFQDDVKEVRVGLECGIKLGDFNEYQVGDIIECYQLEAGRAEAVSRGRADPWPASTTAGYIPMKHRMLRVNEIVRRELSTIITRDLAFDDVLVTINQVDVTPDLKNGARLRQRARERLAQRRDREAGKRANALAGGDGEEGRPEIHAASRFPSRRFHRARRAGHRDLGRNRSRPEDDGR